MENCDEKMDRIENLKQSKITIKNPKLPPL
jgi:hypothetical protein